MSLRGEVTRDEFQKALAPMVAVMREFTAAVDDVGERHGQIAGAESLAMKEIDAQREYAARSSWENPIIDTHTFGALTLRAAADYAAMFAETVAAERTSIWGHLVLTRAALEACVVAAWLNEGEIPFADRVKRGLAEQIYSATEVHRLGIEEDAAEKLQGWLECADALGWKATNANGKAWTRRSRGKPQVAGVGRPPVGDGISKLLLDNPEGARLGDLIFKRLSAVVHVTRHGIQTAIWPVGGSGMAGMARAAIGTDSSAVSAHAFFVLKALRKAATARFTLMGWNDEEWKQAAARAEDFELVLLAAYRAGIPVDVGPEGSKA